MKKYFFDVIGDGRMEYDFRGRDFDEPQKAFQMAHLLALDIEVGAGDECSGGSVHVRNAAGHQLFSVPIAIAA